MKEALELRSKFSPAPYAGGTDLMIKDQENETFLFLHSIPELRNIIVEPDLIITVQPSAELLPKNCNKGKLYYLLLKYYGTIYNIDYHIFEVLKYFFMKRRVLGLVLLLSIILSPTKFVSAAVMSENDSIVTVREITEAEFDQYDLSNWISTTYTAETSEPKVNTRASYNVVNRTFTHNIYANPTDKVPAAILKCIYTLYYYTDYKVHLYTKSITKYTPSEYSNSYYTYGEINNTDGSVSTTKDSFVLMKNNTYLAFLDIFFGATPYEYTGWVS